MLSPILINSALRAFFWSFITIGVYIFTKKLYLRWAYWWLMPLVLTPIIVAAIILGFHENYQNYFQGTHWLTVLIGPVTIAFAIPIYEQRTLIHQHWPVLLIGSIAGSITSIGSSWGLATLLDLDDSLRLSLLPRSISSPFAMEVAHGIGGIPDLTVLFVVLTGIVGAIIGEFMLSRIAFKSALARGACLGVGAHAAGTAQAHKMGSTEGAIASLVMVLVGLLNVLLFPPLSYIFKSIL